MTTDTLSTKQHRTEKVPVDVPRTIAKWAVFELTMRGPADGNPFLDVDLVGRFSQGDRQVRARGFYDGDGIYRVRFMPDSEGTWEYRTESNCPELNGVTGTFECTPAEPSAHGPVEPAPNRELRYRDGTPYYALGTTSYGWANQEPSLVQRTLASLKSSPFNKIRMCVFPKRYEYVANEPPCYPFAEGAGADKWDFTRFNPAYFRNLEKCVSELGRMGIQADIILFHPYDCGHWGFDRMDRDTDVRYLRYVIARLSASYHVWWSVANEMQYMQEKTEEDFHCYFRTIRDEDPYNHLRSAHGRYDHGKGWVSHVCATNAPSSSASKWNAFGKPVVYDEFGYEGDVPYGWGNVNPRELVHQCWLAAASGAYPTAHSECFLSDEGIMWWPHGGELKGESVPRLAFLKTIMAEAPLGQLEPGKDLFPGNSQARLRSTDRHWLLAYTGTSQPRHYAFDLPDTHTYHAEVIDTWNMTTTPVEGEFRGRFDVPLPGRPYLAVRLRACV